jgi:acetyl esterase
LTTIHEGPASQWEQIGLLPNSERSCMPPTLGPPPLEPTVQNFVERLQAIGGSPLDARSPGKARAALADLQSGPIGKPGARIEDTSFPIGPSGSVRVRIVRPANGVEPLPVVMYFHGGGWLLGDVNTHDRLVREIASGARAAVAFVEFSRTPEVQFPIPLEEAYAATKYVAEHGAEHKLDGSRLAVAGDGTGGNIAAAVTLMAKDRRGPNISFQVLFYPVTDARFNSESYTAFQNDPWLSRQAMEWFWNAYLPDIAARGMVTATPLSATTDQLRGLPDALVITAENDVLRDEGEAYARRLWDACVRVTATRYIGTIHDFIMLNALADTPATRGAIAQANAALRASLA